MRQLEVTIDCLTGAVLLQDSHTLPQSLRQSFTHLLGASEEIACAAPAAVVPPPTADLADVTGARSVRLSGYWHNSLIEGPGRRSVAKFQGCTIRCPGCITPDSWDPTGGSLVPVDQLADALLDPLYERDGISILGGEPFFQSGGLLALVNTLRQRGCPHILVYSGYTYERLCRMARREPSIAAVLANIDVLIDGPYVATLAAGAGPWTGSGNQRVIELTDARRRVAAITCARISGSRPEDQGGR
jgi:anaerobic ribonucleoside-triphosphate reductase activating protein